MSSSLHLTNAAHILYLFENTEHYFKNLQSYIKTGLKFGHHLLIIENPVTYAEYARTMRQTLSKEELARIHYVDNQTFYRCCGDFHIQSILSHFSEILSPYLNGNISIRTWAHVEWGAQDHILDKLESFEHIADSSVRDMQLMSVCAYDASSIPARLQTSLMQSHQYLMTDSEFVESTLYRHFTSK